ncbi:MAG: hypothetical protein HY811_06715 [Planctomycetes bacterium]|nr:hypothetical protein [Planctomycetota bacterium]
MVKAIGLLSGGLDSLLAVELIHKQGIDITALHFTTPFCQCDNHKDGCKSSITVISEKLGIKVKTVNNTAEFLKIIQRPRHGYGKNMNPCIDCRILMLKTAGEYMKENGASFLFTGEVLGQRPMSQHKQSLDLIEKKSGLTGLILRPLSAKFLEPTIPEKEGWVDRAKLMGLSGRGRRDQMNLAKLFEIKDYPCPAGGCLLTDPEFCARLKDLIKYGSLAVSEIIILRLGRHFRIDKKTKLIVGRNEQENDRLVAMEKEGDTVIDMTDCPGPAGILRGETNEANIMLAAQITARYADHSETADTILTAVLKAKGQVLREMAVQPLSQDKIKNYIITK